MTAADRDTIEAAIGKLRAAESRLAEAIQCGDTHDACVEALALVRDAIGSGGEPGEPGREPDAREAA